MTLSFGHANSKKQIKPLVRNIQEPYKKCNKIDFYTLLKGCKTHTGTGSLKRLKTDLKVNDNTNGDVHTPSVHEPLYFALIKQ